MDSIPPPMVTSDQPAMTRSEARAMASRPEEQKRLTVAPETVSGKPAILAGDAADVEPLLGLGKGTADHDVVDLFRVPDWGFCPPPPS
jgi:hypothetical protein